jgi:glutaredoxin/glutathione-dependent peroxiredoxin
MGHEPACNMEGTRNMSITIGERLPEASFLVVGEEGPQGVPSAEVFSGKKVVVFAVPGAFTPTCSNAHLPSFVRTAEALSAKGIDTIACIAVNDPYVMAAWGEASGAAAAGIRMLADADGSFTRAVGLSFDVASTGLFGRSRRYSMLVEDGVVKQLNVEPDRACNVSSGETILEQV